MCELSTNIIKWLNMKQEYHSHRFTIPFPAFPSIQFQEFIILSECLLRQPVSSSNRHRYHSIDHFSGNRKFSIASKERKKITKKELNIWAWLFQIQTMRTRNFFFAKAKHRFTVFILSIGAQRAVVSVCYLHTNTLFHLNLKVVHCFCSGTSI